jgi:hypothetical protein
MIDALIPEDALSPEAEKRLLKEMTDILIRAEGYDPSNQNARPRQPTEEPDDISLMDELRRLSTIRPPP